jgi:hypothetical protein
MRRIELESIQSSIVVTGIVLAVAAWSGLAWLIINNMPTVPNRWMFFTFIQIALTGTSLPFVRLIHQRFSSRGGLLIPATVVVRQAFLSGLFVTVCLWLRVPRLLSVPIALLVLGSLIAIEILLRLRERTAWNPDQVHGQPE